VTWNESLTADAGYRVAPRFVLLGDHTHSTNTTPISCASCSVRRAAARSRSTISIATSQSNLVIAVREDGDGNVYTLSMRDADPNECILGRALEVVEISEVNDWLAPQAGVFTASEQCYAESKSDPERRLAARLAAKRAMRSLLDDSVQLGEIEVVSVSGGPPRISLSESAARTSVAKGAERILLSLTHGRAHAAACVLLVRDKP
jgi:holo-[acyl-carrier protein] synthase